MPLKSERGLLIVSPHFPPVNAPDMQRVRMSLPYFREFGWQPYVLAVAPTGDQTLDPLLTETIPPDIPIERVRTVPDAISRSLGIGNIALRALPFLYAAGSRLITEHRIDLVYFSTTMFLSMPLGRVWQRRFGVPYVLDIQDPWLSDYYEQHRESSPPPKYSVARRVHAALEPWTMKEVSALIAVSDAYLTTLRSRYSWLTEAMCTTLPFGASRQDFEVLETHPQPNASFKKHDGLVHGVYVGRGGDDMKPALRILFDALRAGLASSAAVFGAMRLHFVGTDYATDGRARLTVEPVAREAGVADHVSEQTARVPFFEALQLMKDADFLILIGSNDPGYTASKVYPYLMAGKPILAVVHERSSLVPVLRDARAGTVVTFAEGEDVAVAALLTAWRTMMDRLECPAPVDQNVAARYSAREMARRQCVVFDAVLTRARTRAA
jgi:hypothetical protein